MRRDLGKATRVIQLKTGECSLLFDGSSQAGQAVQAFVGVHAQFPVGPAGHGMVDAGVFNDHERDTALGHQTVMVQERRTHHASFTGVAQEQRGHGEPVLEF